MWKYWNLKTCVFQFFRYWRVKKIKQKTKKKWKKKKKKKEIKKHWKPPRHVIQSLFKQFQQKSNVFLFFHWKFNPFTPTAISWKWLQSTLLLQNVFWKVCNKLSNDFQVDRLCLRLWLTSCWCFLSFQFYRYWKG